MEKRPPTDCEDRALLAVLRVRVKQEREANKETITLNLGAVERLLELAHETALDRHLLRLMKLVKDTKDGN